MAFDDTRTNYDGRVYLGANGKSSIDQAGGSQLVDFYFQRKAIIDAKRDMFFGQMADTTTMPKHMGKTIKVYHYIPLLDDRNVNDQGINAIGATTGSQVILTIIDSRGSERRFAADTAANARTLAANALAQYDLVPTWAGGTAYTDAMGDSLATVDFTASTLVTEASPLYVTYKGKAVPLVNDIKDENGKWMYRAPFLAYYSQSTAVTGNMYGNSRDIGTINGKLPVLSETGGRVNRVGFSRVTLEGTLDEFGFFDEYTEDSIQFDTDAELMSHISRETVRAANEINEDLIQKDLLSGAGIVLYGGTATAMSGIGEGDVLTYDMLMKMDKILNENRCPRDTKIISGSRMVDTKTIDAARYVYVGPELKKSLMKMTDYFNNAAFVPVQQYANAGNIANGEIGAIGNFRFIENQNMMYWEGAGAAIDSSPSAYNNGSKVNVYPVLFVGSGCFTTIGFQTSGDSSKFKIYHKAPGAATADRHDPYGKTGFYSIQWWYGSMILRPEWLAVCKVAAEM